MQIKQDSNGMSHTQIKQESIETTFHQAKEVDGDEWDDVSMSGDSEGEDEGDEWEGEGFECHTGLGASLYKQEQQDCGEQDMERGATEEDMGESAVMRHAR